MDIISELPDDLLVKILLQVPTKLAVSTSVLSKRCEYLWMWLPKLNYVPSNSLASACESLQCFLNKNMSSHRARVIESFSLNVSTSLFKPEDIKLWVTIAVSHSVRELEIIYAYDWGRRKRDILPSNLYTCKSLVILKLYGGLILDVPRMVFLPALKTLIIHWVRFFSEESLQRLLSNCPLLEDLSVYLNDYDKTGKLTVDVPSLKSLSLCIPNHHTIDEIAINTPSLEYLKLEYYNDENHYCLIENMPNLIEAYIDVDIPNITSLIGSITHVKHLTICSGTMYDGGFLFNQLEHLELCRCKEHSSDLLVKLLKDSSNLQVLDLFYMDDHDFDDDFKFYWNQPSTIPECMLSSLQTFNWLDYDGEPGERDLAVYILQNAVHLKTARITCVDLDCEVPKSEMLKALDLSSRDSTTFQLIFD